MNKETLRDCWTMFRREHDNISIDRILCDPNLRDAFLRSVQDVAPQPSEKEILWALMGLRKSKQISPKNENFSNP